MRITDLPELSAEDLAENDVVAVDHDTGNGIETRKFRVGKALANKLDKTGDALNVDVLHGKSRIYAKPNENRDGYFPLSSIQKMDITNTLESTTKGTKFYFTLPEGYAILNITLETVYWIGSVYATGITPTSFEVFCAAVGGEPAATGAYTTTAHISMYRTFG